MHQILTFMKLNIYYKLKDRIIQINRNLNMSNLKENIQAPQNFVKIDEIKPSTQKNTRNFS